MDRQDYLGGSDAAAICGVSPWKTPYQLWLEKTGNVEPQDISQNLPVRIGTFLEPMLRLMFTEQTDLAVVDSQERFSHPDHEFIIGHVDGMIDGQPAGWEGKTTGFNRGDWGDTGSDQVPTHYYLQCAHYMACTGMNAWYLSVLISNSDFRTYVLRRDDELIDMLIAREIAFWRHVQDETPPPPMSARDVELIYNRDNGKGIEADQSIAATCEALRAVKAQINDLKAQQEKLESQVKLFMGEHSALFAGSRKLATWKNQAAKRFDTTALKQTQPETYAQFLIEKESRVLRIAK